MPTEIEMQMLDFMNRQQRRSSPVNGVLSAAVASASDGKLTIGDVIVASGIAVSFAFIGSVAGAGTILNGGDTTVAGGIVGDFFIAGAIVAAGRIAIDALSLLEWWNVTFGQFLEWYGERHPMKEREKPMVINYRNVAKSPKSVTTSVDRYELPNGRMITIEKLEQFLLGALEANRWSRDYWCNGPDNLAPGQGLLTKTQWSGLRDYFNEIWGTNDRMAIMELIEDIKANIQ